MALAETLAATAISAYVAFRYETLYLLISASVAPLLLLRTPDSQRLGLQIGLPLIEHLWKATIKVLNAPRAESFIKYDQQSYVSRVKSFLGDVAHSAGLTQFMIYFAIPIIGLTIVGVRTVATLLAFLKSPLESIRRIPDNWWHGISWVDMTQAPEPLAGVNAVAHSPEFQKFGSALQITRPQVMFQQVRGVWAEGGWDLGRLPVLFFTTQLMLIVVFPAWFYRWALKGTFLLYSPMVWVVHYSFSDDPWERLRDICELAVHRLVRGYSVLVLAALSSKVVLDLLVPQWSNLWTSHPSALLLNTIIAPRQLPLWQMAMAVNAVTAWGLYFFADWALARRGRGRAPVQYRIETIVRTAWIVRTVLSVFVIANGVFAAAVLAGVACL
ncbi:hypothetical protein [Corallococcus exercitus]|uniref:hypothetical protein n=1 Tax=Corallococcus exercitus TaxID=2316736 RepID=UPI0035D3F39E